VTLSFAVFWLFVLIAVAIAALGYGIFMGAVFDKRARAVAFTDKIQGSSTLAARNCRRPLTTVITDRVRAISSFFRRDKHLSR
jgi:hypothetical protein